MLDSVRRLIRPGQTNRARSFDASGRWRRQSWPPYQGVNVQITSPVGEKFELQFHTDYSLEVKEGELHTIYEAQRIETDMVKWREYQRQMFEVAGKIPIPPGIRDVS